MYMYCASYYKSIYRPQVLDKQWTKLLKKKSNINRKYILLAELINQFSIARQVLLFFLKTKIWFTFNIKKIKVATIVYWV